MNGDRVVLWRRRARFARTVLRRVTGGEFDAVLDGPTPAMCRNLAECVRRCHDIEQTRTLLADALGEPR